MAMLPPLPLLVTHGPALFWAACGVSALLGLPVFTLRARRRALTAARAAREELGQARDLDAASAEGSTITALGTLELGTPELGTEARLVHPATANATARATASLRVGETLVRLEAPLRIVVGSTERWSLSRAEDRELRSGDRVRVRGCLRREPAGQATGSYRDEASVLVLTSSDADVGAKSDAKSDAAPPVTLAAETAPRVRLSPRAALLAATLSTFLFACLAWGAAKAATEHAWTIATRFDGPRAERAKAIDFAKLGAAMPLVRERALGAIKASVSLPYSESPIDYRDYLLTATSVELYTTGKCNDVLRYVAGSTDTTFTAELGEACGDLEALRVAAFARFKNGEFARASDLLVRAPADSAPVVDYGFIPLYEQAHLHAGRIDRAAEAFRVHARLVPKLYQADAGADRLVQILGCAADACDVRRGNAAARVRLLQSVTDGGRPGACAALYLDTLDGDARVKAKNAVRAMEKQELELVRSLVDEADPAHAAHGHSLIGDGFPAWTFAGSRAMDFTLRADPMGLSRSLVQRLGAVADPPIALRLVRADAAARQATRAALMGDDEAARSLSDLAEADARALAASDPIHKDAPVELTLRRAYIELRGGRSAAPQVARLRELGAQASRSAPFVEELAGLVDFLDGGDLTRLAAASHEFATFARQSRPGRTSADETFAGLEVAGRGSGEELAAWLGKRAYDSVIPVLLAGAGRVKTGQQAVLAWLRRAQSLDGGFPRYTSVQELAAAATNRQRIASALGDRESAAFYGAVAERHRRAAVRRDTAVILAAVE